MGTPPFVPHISNQVPAVMGVVGTLGTADAAGTAPVLPIGVDPTTGAAYVYNLGPAGEVSVAGTDPTSFLPVRLTNGTTFYEASGGEGGGGTTVQFNNGTVDLLKAGTITRLEGGTVQTNLLSGTLTSIPNIPGGTVGLITRVGNIGTLELGTVTGNVGVSSGTLTVLPNIPGGTLGLVTTVTTVSNLTSGSVHMTVGTLTTGTLALATRVGNVGTLELGTVTGNVGISAGTITVLPNTPGGTLGLVTDVTTVSNLTSGSVRVTHGTIVDGTLPLVTTVSNLTSGSVRMTVGTLTTGTLALVSDVANLSKGTITRLEGGSVVITTGTIVNNGGTQGKFDPKPNRNILSFSTTVAGTIGTLVAAPSAGSSIWLTSLDISQVSGTAESVVSFGLAATGAGVVARGNFTTGGGIAKSYLPATNANNTGTALTWNILSGSGTVSYTGHYFIDVP
jgi:hypothetical protein